MNALKFKRKKGAYHAPMSGLCCALGNIQLKIDAAAGSATALEMRLRIVAELLQEVQAELSKRTKDSYHEAKLYHLIPAVLKVFQDHLSQEDRQCIERCRPPRNKLSHASFVEFMLAVNGSAPGRMLNPLTGKPYELKKENLMEASLSVDHSRAFENFTCTVKTAVAIVEAKIMQAMNLSANYNVGLRDLFGPSAPKNETFFGVPSAFALANLQVGFESTRCTGLQKYPRIPNTLLCG
jgi:hypothetical protein